MRRKKLFDSICVRLLTRPPTMVSNLQLYIAENWLQDKEWIVPKKHPPVSGRRICRKISCVNPRVKPIHTIVVLVKQRHPIFDEETQQVEQWSMSSQFYERFQSRSGQIHERPRFLYGVSSLTVCMIARGTHAGDTTACLSLFWRTRYARAWRRMGVFDGASGK
jgi:hypothetical protein